MPRHRKRDTSPDTRFRNMLEAQGRPAIAGLSRIGAGGGTGFGGLSPSILQPEADPDTTGAAHLLCMSVAADSVASGGDHIAFDAIVAQQGFDGAPAPKGGAWIHPVGGVYVLNLELAWASYTGGGTVELTLDDVAIPEGVLAAGTSGQYGRGSLVYFAPAGAVGRIRVSQSSGSDQTCSATLHVAVSDPSGAEREDVLVDTFYVDSRAHSQDPAHNTYAESTEVLEAGLSYTIVVDGTWTKQSQHPLPYGTGEPITYLSSGQSQRDAGLDADVIFADQFAGTFPRHETRFVMNLGSGWSHIEPVGGPFSNPQPDHAYRFAITGEGSKLKAAITDTPINDNNGRLRVRIYQEIIA